MERRKFIKSVSATCASGLLGFSVVTLAQGIGDDYEGISDTPFKPRQLLYGTKPALGEEDDMARKILGAAPMGKSLIETAKYFETLPDKNGSGLAYNAQWPNTPGERWNPVLVGFYQSTTLDKRYIYKRGDTIDWCAAFMNWCMAQSGYKPTSSNSAMSGAYRTYGRTRDKKEAPVAGDIIVFKRIDDIAGGNAGHGHVAIYLSSTADAYEVLGGNQKDGKKYSSVNTTLISKSNSRLGLHSYRDISGMRLISA